MAVLAQPVDLFHIPLGACVLFALLTLTLLVAIVYHVVTSAPETRRRPRAHGFDVVPPKNAAPGHDDDTEPR
jgi:hypothetical protein